MPSPDERIIGDDVGDDFPLPEGSVPGRITPPEPKIDSAKVLPRGGGVSSRKLARDFFQGKSLHIEEDGHRRATRGPRRQGARLVGVGAPPPSWPGCGPPLVFSSLNNSY